jgi:hypothetical protein
MDAPDPEGMSLLAKVVAAAVAFVVPVWGARSWLEKRFALKVDKHSYKNDQQTLSSTLEVYRVDISRIRDVLRDQDAVAEQRHRELLMHLLERKP